MKTRNTWVEFASTAGIAALVLAQAACVTGMNIPDSHYAATQLVKDTPFGGANGATIGVDGALYVVHTGDGTTTRVDLKTMKAERFIPPYAGTFIPDDIAADD
jgi:hypothetical protein